MKKPVLTEKNIEAVLYLIKLGYNDKKIAELYNQKQEELKRQPTKEDFIN